MDILMSPWTTLAILAADVVLVWIFIRDFRQMKRLNEKLDEMERTGRELNQLVLRKKEPQEPAPDDTIPF